MIDHLDKQTQTLPLEQKRGRGRPATGQALSNAERQRRYREAQKAQRNENMHKEVAEELRAELAKALEDIELLSKKNTELLKQLRKQKDQLEQRNDNELMKRVRELEAQLEQRNEKLADHNDQLKGVWIVEYKRHGSRTWKICGNPETNLTDARKAVNYMQFKSGSGQGEEWRAIRADGLIYWPLWSKAKAAK